MADAGHNRGGRRPDAGQIGPTLLKFALPTLASSILQSLNGTVNAIWVGRFLGEDALAATSNANMVMFLLTAFVFGFGMASTILIGQYWGRKDVDEARQIFGTAIGGFTLVTILVAHRRLLSRAGRSSTCLERPATRASSRSTISRSSSSPCRRCCC